MTRGGAVSLRGDPLARDLVVWPVASRRWTESTPSTPGSTSAISRWRRSRRGRCRRSGMSSSRRTPARRSSASITFSRFRGSLLARNSRTRSGGGSVPVRSRQTRRRNSESLASSDGTIWNLRSFSKTCSSMKFASRDLRVIGDRRADDADANARHLAGCPNQDRCFSPTLRADDYPLRSPTPLPHRSTCRRPDACSLLCGRR